MSFPLQHPLMLDDLKQNFQRISASMPPDNWGLEPPRFTLRREDSGLFDFQPLNNPKHRLERQPSFNTLRPSQTDERELLGPILEVENPSDGNDQHEERHGQRRIWCWKFPRTSRSTFHVNSGGGGTKISKSICRRLKDCILRLWPLRKRESWKKGSHSLVGPMMR